MDLDARTTALVIARGRVGAGLALLVLPGVVARLLFGRTSAEARTLLRMVGVRDLILGVGAITALKEQTQDAEWVGMGAVCDGADAVAMLLAPSRPSRRVLNALVGASSAVQGMLCARQLADARPRPQLAS